MLKGCHSIVKLLLNKVPGMNYYLSVVIGVLLGIGAYKLVSSIIDQILIRLYGLEPLSAFDRVYLTDTKDYNMNMLGAVKTTKFKFEDMKEFFYENYCMKHKRARSRLVIKFGRYFYEEIPRKEFDKMIDYLFVKVVEPMKDEQAIMTWAKRF